MIEHSCLIEHVLYNLTAVATATTATTVAAMAIMILTTVQSMAK